MWLFLDRVSTTIENKNKKRDGRVELHQSMKLVETKVILPIISMFLKLINTKLQITEKYVSTSKSCSFILDMSEWEWDRHRQDNEALHKLSKRYSDKESVMPPNW